MVNLAKNYVVSNGFDESGRYSLLSVVPLCNYSNSFRLYLQHWMWKAQAGWDLHPLIKLPETGEIRIADLGCGNG